MILVDTNFSELAKIYRQNLKIVQYLVFYYD
jgi:hypothetical protein